MRIVVTGALGHIGSRLIRMLPDAFPQAEIVLLDNLATQRYPSLFSLPSDATYRFVEFDILRDSLDEVFANAHSVVHLAALTDPGSSVDNRLEVERVNLTGTSRIADACIRAGCALFHASSTSVYGSAAAEVDEESRAHLAPQSPYAETKLKEEDLLRNLGVSQGLRFAICRFGTICGVSPGMRFHTAVNRFCWQAVTGRPLTVWRTALAQKRPYLDLAEAVEAIKFILQRDLFAREVYNVLSENLTVATIVDIIRSRIPDLQVEYIDSPIMNELSYDVLDSKFRRAGFEFRGSVQRCIADTISLLGAASSARSYTHAD